MRRRSSRDLWLTRCSGSWRFAPARPWSALLGLVLVCMLLVAAKPSHAAPEEVAVAGVRVAGNLRTDEAAILNTFALDPGKVYPYEEVRTALERIFRMGFFDDVRLYLETVPTGQQLTIEVVERPVVSSIKVTGHSKIKKQDVTAKIAVAVGSSLDQRLVHESVGAIKALYKENGFYLVDVTPDVTPASSGTVAITFKIAEGIKLKVDKIAVQGNKSIASGAIKKVMETKEKRILRGKQDFKPEKYDSDVDKIVRLYRDQGFVNARVTAHEVNVNQAKGLADLTVTVDEGRRVYLKGVKIDLVEDEDSEGKISEEALEKSVRLELNKPYSAANLDKTLEAMYSTLGDQGYVYGEIEPVESVQADSVSLTLSVKAGRAVHVGKIVIEGNETTLEKVIRRELLIRPGDILRRSVVERSHRDLFNLGYFDDVQVNSRVANEQGDIDLILKVKERQTGIANVGAGYSEEFGLTGFIEFSHNNMGWFRKPPYLGLGKGESLNLRWEFGRLTQIELGYRNPWFRDRPTLVGIDIYDTRREYETYADKRGGFGLVTGRRFSLIDYSKVYVRYSLERRELVPDATKASEFVKSQAGKRTTSSTNVTLVRNSVDNPFFPRAGSRTNFDAEWAGGWLGGTTAYQIYTVETSNFMAVPLLNSALIFRVKTGLLDGLGSKGYMPVYERFRLGGTTTEGVRGYDDRELVPEGNASDQGGRFMLIGSLEYRVPVIKNQAFVRGFLDAGDTWNSVRASRPGLLKRSAGLGFMIEIPMVGQIGLDVGYGFDRDQSFGGPGWKTHFQFGMSGL